MLDHFETGRAAGERAGEAWRAAHPGDQRPTTQHLRELARQAWRTDPACSHEAYLRGGYVRGFVAGFRDVTERARGGSSPG